MHRLLAQMGPVSCLKYARPMRPAQPVPSRLLPVPSQTLRGTAVLRHLWRAPPRPPPLSERAGEGRVQGVGKGALGAGPELGAPHPCCHQARGWTAFVFHATRSPEAAQAPPSLEVLPEQPPRADGGGAEGGPQGRAGPGLVSPVPPHPRCLSHSPRWRRAFFSLASHCPASMPRGGLLSTCHHLLTSPPERPQLSHLPSGCV